VKAAQLTQETLLTVDRLRADWRPGRWHAVARAALPRLVMAVSNVLSFQSFIARDSLHVARSSMQVFVGTSGARAVPPDCIEADFAGVTFRLHLAPGCAVLDAPGVLVPSTYHELKAAQVLKAEWTYAGKPG
jgi:hypothetical protein